MNFVEITSLAAVKYFWMPAFMIRMAGGEEGKRDLDDANLKSLFRRRGQTLTLLAEHILEGFALAEELGYELI
jgi:hypothetical protein